MLRKKNREKMKRQMSKRKMKVQNKTKEKINKTFIVLNKQTKNSGS